MEVILMKFLSKKLILVGLLSATFFSNCIFAMENKQESEKNSDIASILNIALEWEHEGTKTTFNESCLEYEDGTSINVPLDKEFPAVKFSKEEGQNFKVYKVTTAGTPLSNNHNKILEIKAKNGDWVYMMVDWFMYGSGWGMGGFNPFKSFYLLNAITMWQASVISENEITDYDEAIFPMVNIGYEVVQALQQTKFQMNEKGAKIISAAAMNIFECTACCEPKPKKALKFDDSFYLWIVRPGMKTPIFAAYIDTDAWKASIV
jgi:hypothetical protein